MQTQVFLLTRSLATCFLTSITRLRQHLIHHLNCIIVKSSWSQRSILTAPDQCRLLGRSRSIGFSGLCTNATQPVQHIQSTDREYDISAYKQYCSPTPHALTATSDFGVLLNHNARPAARFGHLRQMGRDSVWCVLFFVKHRHLFTSTIFYVYKLIQAVNGYWLFARKEQICTAKKNKLVWQWWLHIKRVQYVQSKGRYN